MAQMTLAVQIALPGENEEKHDKNKCPFCKEDAPAEKGVAVIGKDNNSKTLGDNLESSPDPDPKADHLYEDSEHGMYSAEAHHLICGNEILGDHKHMEKFLVTTTKDTSKHGKGFIEDELGDVPWDVNSSRNGIWLPSVPDMYRKTGGKAPDVWWGYQKKSTGRTSLRVKQKREIAYKVMEAEKLQFHKGSHKNAAKPERNYVKLGKEELDNIKKFVKYYSKECPTETNGKKRGTQPIYPPCGLATILDLLSDRLKMELEGHPRSWNYFISVLARECRDWFNEPGNS